jgi:hypothetical protein
VGRGYPYGAGMGVESAAMDVREFVAKWRASQLKESAAYVSHFEDLCRLVGHQTPLEMDPSGGLFEFQRKVATEEGRPGFADVWYRGHFAVEYKGKQVRDLGAAFQQLLRYRSNLETSPLLIACNFDTIEIRTDFTGYVSRTYRIGFDELLSGDPLPGPEKTAMQVGRATAYAVARLSRSCLTFISVPFGPSPLFLKTRRADDAGKEERIQSRTFLSERSCNATSELGPDSTKNWKSSSLRNGGRRLCRGLGQKSWRCAGRRNHAIPVGGSRHCI